MRKHFNIAILLSIIVATLYILLSDYYCFPWQDEIYTVDTAVNYVLYGDWNSTVWKYTYPPLYGLLQVGWLFLFGVSHMSVCSLEIVLALICYLLILRICSTRKLFTKPISVYLLFILYWFGFYFPTIFTQGRMDMLVMLFTILLINRLISHDKEKINNVLIAFYAALVALSALYPLPAIAAFAFFLFLMAEKDQRKDYFKKGVWVAFGMAIGLCGTMAFSILTHTLHRSLNTVAELNQNLSVERIPFFQRVLNGYCDIPTFVMLMVAVLLLKFSRNNTVPKYYALFLFLLPLIMVLAGRYERYYFWLAYIPVVLYFVESIDFLKSARLRTALFTIFGLSSLLYQVYVFQYPGRYVTDYYNVEKSATLASCRSDVDFAEEIVKGLEGYLCEGTKVFFVSDCFYYPLVGLSLELRDIWGGMYENYVYCDRGVFCALNTDEINEFVDFCKANDYSCNIHCLNFGAREGGVITFSKVAR